VDGVLSEGRGAGKLRRLHNQELRDLYCAPYTVWMMKQEWCGQDVCNLWERVLVGTSEAKRQLGRPTHRMEDNIKIDLIEIFRQGVVWTGLIRDRDTWRAIVDTWR